MRAPCCRPTPLSFSAAGTETTRQSVAKNEVEKQVQEATSRLNQGSWTHTCVV